MKQKLRVGVVLDSPSLDAWEFTALELVRDSEFADLSAAVMITSPVPGKTAGFLSKLNRILFKSFRRFEASRRSTYHRPAGVLELFSGLPRVEITCDGEGNLDGQAWEQINNLGMDVIFWSSRAPLPSTNASTATHGIWTYVRPSNTDTPIGFWETLRQSETTVMQLVRLGKETSSAEVLYVSHGHTLLTWTSLNSNLAYWKAASFLSRALRRVHTRAAEKDRGPACEEEPIRAVPAPTNLNLFIPLTGHAVRRIRRSVEKRVFRDQWKLLYSFREGDTRFEDFGHLSPPKGSMWADPFVYEKDGEHYIFLEELVYARNVGFISVMRLHADGSYDRPVPIIKMPCHMSYPFLFEHDGELYMLPQTSNRKVQLYRCTDFPFKWEFAKDLMSEINAVDTTLLRHDGKWWMFTTVIEPHSISPWDELFIFYADSPLDTLWTPHPGNPVISDTRRARGAGMFYRDGSDWIRPSQNCSPRYGYGIQLNRVSHLSISDYREELIESFEPTWDKSIKAMHTINRTGRLTVIDVIQRRSKHW